MEPNSRHYWQQQYESWQKSSISKKSFCLTHDLCYPSFIYWSNKFKELNEETMALKAVAVSFTQTLSPDQACIQRVADLCISTDRIEIPHASGQAHIIITGQISILALARLVEASTNGASSNVQA